MTVVEWLQDGVGFHRWQVLLVGLLIGSLCAIGIVLASNAISDVKREAANRKQSDTLSRTQIEQLVRRIVHIEQPSQHELVYSVRRALHVCLANNTCRVELMRVTAGRPQLRLVEPPRAVQPRQPRRPHAPPRPTSPGKQPAPPQPSPTQGTPTIPSAPPPPAPLVPQLPSLPPLPCTTVSAGDVHVQAGTCS